MKAVNLANKLAGFDAQWQPHIVAEYNGNDVMVVKVQGEFNWHSHPGTDDFFMVLKGEVDIELRDRTITVKAGEIYIVPAGVEHRPVAKAEAHLMIIEPAGTPNSGDASTAVVKPRI